MKTKILVVDDEPSISTLIDFNLKQAGYDVKCVMDGEAVFEAVHSFKPDLVVLDLMLPKLDGIQVCRKLRNSRIRTPIIMLSAMQELNDRIAGLDNGADDYMTKPFSPMELVSRIHALLRRARMHGLEEKQEPAPTYQVGGLLVSPEQREALLNEELLDLTPKEFELLVFLCKHRGMVLSRQQLLLGVWDYHFVGDTRIVDVHISHLRDKIESDVKNPQYIVTVRNVGYKLREPVREVSTS
ncbi:response regulator transcription factor [Paenibacillus mesotrionivorans]|uniref:Response regulator transcription factor n=1 Tax=Paenibacillus mesotrionivorans TaxID=3160968 RepID=A0ACC7NT03_9BACL